VDGAPSWFGAWIVFVIIAGIVGLAVRVSLARRFAREAGIDEDEATTAAVFGTGAVTATYLAASAARQHGTAAAAADQGHVIADLSGASAPTDAPATPARSSADRLRELERLRDQKLITDSEYDARRKAILESI
jgi:hypothetical protein